MAKQGRGGYRAAKNFEPSRASKPKRKPRSSGAAASAASSEKRNQRDGSAQRPPRPRRDDRTSASRDERRSPRRDDRSSARAQRDREPQRSPRVDKVDEVLAKLEAVQIDPAEVSELTFADVGLGRNIVSSLAQLGAEHPFAIQAATIPDILQGRDVLARGRTGSGKTIAFGAPLVESLLRDNVKKSKGFGRAPRALILAPTRELALQIDRTVQPIAQSVGLFTTQVYGGVPQGRQVGALKRGVDIVIGTPGRVEDLMNQGHLDLSSVRIAVLDEADHMCELGFLEPVQRILHATNPEGQRLLFSATLDSGVSELASEFLSSPAVYEIAGEDQASGTIDHRVLVVNREDKFAVIQQLISSAEKALVFTRTRAYAERLGEMLEDEGVDCVTLHGDLNQAKRTRNLEKLNKGRVNVLVATDVAARGIHIDDIDLVIQADPPDEFKTYLHRSGRTGRAGREGTVVTIIPRTRQKKTRELLQRAEISAQLEDFRPGDRF